MNDLSFKETPETIRKAAFFNRLKPVVWTGFLISSSRIKDTLEPKLVNKNVVLSSDDQSKVGTVCLSSCNLINTPLVFL